MTSERPGESLETPPASPPRDAFSAFLLNIRRAETLRMVSISGIDEHHRTTTRFHAELTAAIDREADSPQADSSPAPGMVQISRPTAIFARNFLGEQREILGELRYYLHNALCVAAWGAFEGYIQGVLGEVFAAHPNLLASDKMVSVKEIVATRMTVTDYLIAKEIDDVGRLKFLDLQAYLRSKLKCQISNRLMSRMREVYFLRNIIAHSAGFLRRDQISKIPSAVRVEGDQIKLEAEYLGDAIRCVRLAVTMLDKHLKRRYAPTPVPPAPNG